MSIRVGDTVTRKSYGNDVLFNVISINKAKRMVTLQGLDVRLVADAPIEDVVKIDPDTLNKEREKIEYISRESLRLIQQERRLMREKNQWQQAGYPEREGTEQSQITFEIPGSVLHLDGDGKYLERCLEIYKELGIPVQGVHMQESQMPLQVLDLLQRHQPNVLVLTGHDAYRKQNGDQDSLEAYRNSKYYVQAVVEARKYEPNKDRLIIFAGACQSKFESLLEAGANFASSPKRINIHTLDPVYIVEKVAFTSIRETINVFELAKNTITGIDGLGGIETFGTFRLGLPVTDSMRRYEL